MEEQLTVFQSGNELAAYAAKQINYHIMGYYPITPSTQIAESLDSSRADGEIDTLLIAAEGEHSAAGICYGASVCGARVINATSANGLLYALEQFPVQSGTRFPMVLNVACRTVSGPLNIKGDHSDVMYLLNTGWILLFAPDPQAVYDFNILALKLAEACNLPVAIAFDGFFTSHQKRRCQVFCKNQTVLDYIGEKKSQYDLLDLSHPITIGSYMNEADLINNKYQLHLAMEQCRLLLPLFFSSYEKLSGRSYSFCNEYHCEDASVILILLGSSYATAQEAVDLLRNENIMAGAATLYLLRPFPYDEIYQVCKHASLIIVGDRQDSYGAGGGNLSLEIRGALQRHACTTPVLSRVYGLGGKDFFVEDAVSLIKSGMDDSSQLFDYYGITPGSSEENTLPRYFPVFSSLDTEKQLTTCEYDAVSKKVTVSGGKLSDCTAMPSRLAPGHGACPGCGIPVNINLLLKGIEGNVVLLFQTGCGMVVTTPYPKTSFRIPYLHNLFQNGAATLSGVVEAFHQRQTRGEYPNGDITFLMVSGDGGMDIGMGSSIGTALRNHHLIIFEYDNGGYMNTGYQLSYSTPMGAKSATSHVGIAQYGKNFFHKDTPAILAATGIPFVATVAESHPTDFIRKAAKAAFYSKNFGTAYIKALSACPLNWNDPPNTERKVIAGAVDCCYFPLYEVEQGITCLSYNPKTQGKKIPVLEWFSQMGRTKHLTAPMYQPVVEEIQAEIDHRFDQLCARSEHPLL